MAPSRVLSVYYDKICLKFASYHVLLYVVYMCQKSLNFTYAFKCYHQKNVSWPHFSWPTLYRPMSHRILSQAHTSQQPLDSTADSNSSHSFTSKTVRTDVLSKAVVRAQRTPAVVDVGVTKWNRPTVHVNARSFDGHWSDRPRLSAVCTSSTHWPHSSPCQVYQQHFTTASFIIVRANYDSDDNDDDNSYNTEKEKETVFALDR